jgi:hypothetical protein
MATVPRRQLISHSANAKRAGVNGPNERTGWASRAAGTQAQLAALPRSKPAACGGTQGRASGRGGCERRLDRGGPPTASDSARSRAGQDAALDPAQRGRRSARATPPLITARLTSTSLVHGLSTTPVGARSSLVWTQSTRIPHWHHSLCPHAYRIGVWESRHNFRYICGPLSRPSL